MSSNCVLSTKASLIVVCAAACRGERERERWGCLDEDDAVTPSCKARGWPLLHLKMLGAQTGKTPAEGRCHKGKGQPLSPCLEKKQKSVKLQHVC